MKIAFLCNPAVHRVKKFPALVSLIQKFVPAEREIFLVDRSLPRSLETHVERILDGGYERIAVAGGDGTLNRAVNALLARRALEKVTLGIVPFGTCNDFARSLNLSPLRLPVALKALTKNKARRIDIGRVNGHFAVHSRNTIGGEHHVLLAGAVGRPGLAIRPNVVQRLVGGDGVQDAAVRGVGALEPLTH